MKFGRNDQDNVITNSLVFKTRSVVGHGFYCTWWLLKEPFCVCKAINNMMPFPPAQPQLGELYVGGQCSADTFRE